MRIIDLLALIAENLGRRKARVALTARRSYSLRLAAFYGALFTVYGVHLPYLPVWLDVRGLSAEEIAVIAAAPYFLRVLITPAVAMWADGTGQHRALINGLAWLALALVVLLAQATSFWPILLLAVPFAIAVSTTVPMAETIAVAGVRAHGLDYGRMRLWGSITFVAAGFTGGWLIDHVGAGAIIGCILAGVVAMEAAARLSRRPRWRWLAVLNDDAMAGASLRRAQAVLDEIARFEEETTVADA